MGARSTELIESALRALEDERLAYEIYSNLARLVRDEGLSKKLLQLAGMEKKHIAFWEEFLRSRGEEVKPPGGLGFKLKLKMYLLLFRMLGVPLTFKLLETDESKATEFYTYLLEHTELSQEERARLMELISDEVLHEHLIVEEEEKFRDYLDYIRDSVLGMSDGIVEILSVTSGLAGAYGNPFYVAIGGAVVGVAGALSMGLGTYSGVRAQKQIRLGVITRLRLAGKYARSTLVSILTKRLRERGISEKVTKELVRGVQENGKLLSDLVASEEYGIKEERLEEPVKAGLYTGISYILGALFPVVPYVFAPIHIALPLSFLTAAVILGLTGFIIAINAGISIGRKVLELIAIGFTAAAITFLLGRAINMLFGIEV